MAFVLAGARVFDGDQIRDGLAVIVEGSRIADVVSAARIAPGMERRQRPGRSNRSGTSRRADFRGR